MTAIVVAAELFKDRQHRFARLIVAVAAVAFDQLEQLLEGFFDTLGSVVGGRQTKARVAVVRIGFERCGEGGELLSGAAAAASAGVAVAH